MPEPGVTFGPAVSRYTRVPINYAPGAVNESLPDAPILKYLPFLAKLIPSLAAHSTVNSEGANPAADARHEDIHNLMYQLFGTGDTPVSQDQKDAIARSLTTRDTGAGLNKEIPAYMGAFNPQETPLDANVRDQFVKDFTQKLQEVSPKGAAIYKRLSSK